MAIHFKLYKILIFCDQMILSIEIHHKKKNNVRKSMNKVIEELYRHFV